MNSYFYKYWLPFHIFSLAIIGYAITYSININWFLVFIVWFLIGPIGNGVGSHKLFSHRQFVTSKPIEYTLALLSTVNGYAPLHFWAATHTFHHQHSDKTGDYPSPKLYGFWQSFIGFYRFKNGYLDKKVLNLRNHCTKQILKDKILMILSKNFILINWSIFILLLILGIDILLSMYIIPVLIEHFRLNLVSSLLHTPIKYFNYRNFDTPDNSQNNIIVGYLSMGFGWHNNHHYNQRDILNWYKWWEIDIEGLIALLLSKKI